MASYRFWEAQFDLQPSRDSKSDNDLSEEMVQETNLGPVDLVRDVLCNDRPRERSQTQNRLLSDENLDLDE